MTLGGKMVTLGKMGILRASSCDFVTYREIPDFSVLDLAGRPRRRRAGPDMKLLQLYRGRLVAD